MNDIEILIPLIRNATKFNLHTMARLEIAKHFKLDVQHEKLRLMLKIQDLEGNCPRQLQELREIWTTQMLFYIEKNFGKEISEKIEAEL